MPEKLSFAHHHHVLSIPDLGERMRWLEEAARQGWSVAVLRDELRIAHAITTRVDVLNVRVMEETYRLALEAAERRGMDPRVWCIEAIREQAARELPELATAVAESAPPRPRLPAVAAGRSA